MAQLVQQKGYRPARFLKLGNLIILLGILLKIVNNAQWIDFTLHSNKLGIVIFVYASNISMVLDIVILSFALGDRIRFLEQVKKQSQVDILNLTNENMILNAELEKKITERTRRIEEQNEILKIQASKISDLNVTLSSDNIKLSQSIIQEKEARISLRPVSFDEFSLIYSDEEQVYLFLENVKWGNGYTCKRCGSSKYGKGNTPFARRCLDCRYDESVKVFTAFNKCRFDLRKALYLIVLANRYGDSMSIADVSKEIDIRYGTCQKFLQKLFAVTGSKAYLKLKDEDKLNYLILNTKMSS